MDTREEFDHVFRKYYAPLFVFAKRFVEDEEDCHDLVDDVFEDVWTHFHDIKSEAIKSYIYVDLRWKCLDFLRRKQTERRYINSAKALSDRFDTDEHIREMEERERKIKQVLDSLKPPTKEIFTLCFVEHKKYAEAAEVLHVSIATIKKHIVRALRLIREQRSMVCM